MTKSLVREAFKDAYNFAIEHYDIFSYDDWALMTEKLDKYDRELTQRLILGFLETLYGEQEVAHDTKIA